MFPNDLDLTDEQCLAQANFKNIVDKYIVPYAAQWDQTEQLPYSLINDLIENNCWGTEIPIEYGGQGFDLVTYGLLSEEIGRGCANVRNLLGVQGMVSVALNRWGSKEQKRDYLPKMASGEIVAAFALTEPDIGSDARNIETVATLDGSDYILNGQKKWISFGQNADLFLLFAQYEGEVTAFLVDRTCPGFSTKPITGLLGFRSSMLANVYLDHCRIPKENIVGWPGLGLSYIASFGLLHGRYSTVWGCVGLAQACLEACLDYASNRKQFAVYLKEHQLVKGMIADMVTNITAARLLSHRVGQLMDSGDVRAMTQVAVAKYFASTMVVKVANDAVQIHGANGCSSQYPVQRHLRDAKIMEIVEGSTQIQQLLIADHALRGVVLKETNR